MHNVYLIIFITSVIIIRNLDAKILEGYLSTTEVNIEYKLSTHLKRGLKFFLEKCIYMYHLKIFKLF